MATKTTTMKSAPSKIDSGRRMAVLTAIASGTAKSLEEVLELIPRFSDDPAAHPQSGRLEMAARACSFAGYWGVATFLTVLSDLAYLIETEPQERAGRTEFLERVAALKGACSALMAYLVDVAKGINASNVDLNNHFRITARKTRPHLLDIPPEKAREDFFMAVPLSLEIEALWNPATGASREALIEALNGVVSEFKGFDRLVRANPYASLSGLFEGLATQSDFVVNPENRVEIVACLRHLLSKIESEDLIIPPQPGARMMSRLLFAAAYNLGTDEAVERYRRRYALLYPDVMKANEGVVSMHGLAKQFSEKLKVICDAYTQATIMRTTGSLKSIAETVKLMSLRLGTDASEQLSLGFSRTVETILAAEAAGADTQEIWLRGAQILLLMRHAVQTWHSDESQMDLLALASEVLAGQEIPVSMTLMRRYRENAIERSIGFIRRDLETFKLSMHRVAALAQGEDLPPSTARQAATSIGIPNSEIFKQAAGLMATLGLTAASQYGHRIARMLMQEENWARKPQRMVMFETIARYTVFLGRLRASTLIDLETEEMTEADAKALTDNRVEPSMGVFDLEPTEVVELAGEAWAAESIALQEETGRGEPAQVETHAETPVAETDPQTQEPAAETEPETETETETGADADAVIAQSDEVIPQQDDVKLRDDEVMPEPIQAADDQTDAFLRLVAKPTLQSLTEAFGAAHLEHQDDMRELDEELATVMSEEARACMDAVSAGMERLSEESQDHDEVINVMADIKRNIHTVKGVSRTSGLMRAGAVFHAMEDEMERLGTDAAEFLHLLPAFAAAHKNAEKLLAPLYSSLELMDLQAAPDLQPEPEADLLVVEAKAEPQMAAAELGPAPAVADPLVPVLPVVHEVVEITPVAAPAPAPVPAPTKSKADATVRLPLDLVTQVGAASGNVLAAERRLRASIDRLRKIARSLDDNIKRMSASIRDIEIKAAASIAASSASVSGSTDFDPLELDRYTDLQERVRTLSETHRDVLADIDELNAALADVDRDEGDLQEVSDELQRDSSGMLLTPLASQAARLHSAVKRAAADTGKDTDLRIARDCRLPAAAMDKLMPVFEHLLRNSVAHGIESDRASVSKPSVGTITIEPARSTTESAGTVAIAIRDDGAGINTKKVLAIAIQRGLAKPGVQYTQEQVQEFIFSPGFSTADTVSQLAGRGVGLDVVRDAVSRLGGVVTVSSVQGGGTEFTLSIPTDFATMAVLPVRCAGISMLVPVSMIHEVLPLGSSAPVRLEQGWGGFMLDGHPLDVVRLADKVGVTARTSGGYLVVMREGGASKAVEVEAVEAQYRATVSPLGPYVRGIPGLLAGTILQGGGVGLIVNPLRMLNAAAVDAARVQTPKREAACLMVVDDSPSMRIVTQRVVKRLGYRCVTAIDGLDALAKLSTGIKIDGFLVDLEMPGMDGFTLIAELRRTTEHENTPVVVISSRTAQKHMERALEVGADEYLTKPYDETEMARAIEKFIARERVVA